MCSSGVIFNHLGFILIGFVGPLGFWVHRVSDFFWLYIITINFSPTPFIPTFQFAILSKFAVAEGEKNSF
jgi:hypothetical protein